MTRSVGVSWRGTDRQIHTSPTAVREAGVVGVSACLKIEDDGVGKPIVNAMSIVKRLHTIWKLLQNA